MLFIRSSDQDRNHAAVADINTTEKKNSQYNHDFFLLTEKKKLHPVLIQDHHANDDVLKISYVCCFNLKHVLEKQIPLAS